MCFLPPSFPAEIRPAPGPGPFFTFDFSEGNPQYYLASLLKNKIISKFVEKESGVAFKRFYSHRVLRIAKVP